MRSSGIVRKCLAQWGIREQAERRGLLRVELDVITFVITSLFCCSTHFARNDVDSAWTVQLSSVTIFFWGGQNGTEKRQMDLKGRTVVVTGGNSGIGLATATALAQAGSRVVVGSRDQSAIWQYPMNWRASTTFRRSPWKPMCHEKAIARI
jgi:hypothetical protein